MQSFSEFITESSRSELLARRMAKFKELFAKNDVFKIVGETKLSYKLDFSETFDYYRAECYYVADRDELTLELTTGTLEYMNLSNNLSGVRDTFKIASNLFDRIGKLAARFEKVLGVDKRNHTVRIKTRNTEGTSPSDIIITFVCVMEHHDVLP